ncbi:MAG: preprotein translocase subunit SecG [Clostridia bacterium]|nr:preprotein translocase subunit SecG [Clostridia bacterium]
MLSILLDGNTRPAWVSSSFPYIQGVLIVLIAIFAIVITVAVLLSPSNPDGGNNAITGKNESYYGYNKGDTKEGRLNKLIIISSIIILVLAIAYLITFSIYSGYGA